MLKKRFRILKIPLPCRDVKLVADIVHCCCILHNMILMDKGRMNIGHLQGDWIDKGPDASKARRELYDKANGRTFLLNGRAYITNDHTDYMLRGNQTSAPDYCDATQQRVTAAFQARARTSPCGWHLQHKPGRSRDELLATVCHVSVPLLFVPMHGFLCTSPTTACTQRTSVIS